LLRGVHRKRRHSFWNIAAVAIIGPAIALAAVVALGGAFGSF
jgi:hypothetical protein